MKKLTMLFIISLGLIAGESVSAQVNVSINIGRPVVSEPWYAHDDDYYYMPDQGVYYNIPRGVYVYYDNGRWVFAASLPAVYGNITYRKAHCVRVRDRAPFDRDDEYRQRYRHDNGKHKGWYKHGNGHHHDEDNDDNDNHGHDHH